MNTRHYYFRLLRTLALAALTAAATAACSDDNGDPDGREPINPDDANPGIAVNFTANINPGSSDADPAAPGTRTVLTPDGNGGFTVEWKGKADCPEGDYDQIKIWAVKGTTTIGPKTYMPLTSGASSVLEPEDDSQKLTLTETGEWKFTAVYGVYLFMGGEPVVELLNLRSQSAPGNTEHIASQDFSVATATQTVAAENAEMPQSINLKFEHKLSALQLRITNQTGEALTVREIRLSADGGQIAHSRFYDIATGDWKATGEAKRDYLQLTADNFPALPSGGTESQDLHMLLFPGYENDTLTVTVITSRGEYSRTKPAPDGGFLAAKNYLTDITIKTSGLTAEEKWVETISNKAELIAFRDKVNGGNNYTGKTVRLTADIDLANETWTTPIGTSSKSFQGTFDGGGYHISKLSVDNGSEHYAGLFGRVSAGTVRNLRVSGTVTTTGNFAGGIAGKIDVYSTVENCIFDGDVSGNKYVGGIAGYSDYDSRIAGCHTKGTVTVTGTTSQAAGGIAGCNSGSTIDGCYSEAEVKVGYREAGGIAGRNENGGTITYCYATGKVSGKSGVGGIVGYQYNGTLTGGIALNPGLTMTEYDDIDFGRVVGYNDVEGLTSCAAFDGMTITDASNDDFFLATTGEHGTALTATDCLTKTTYTNYGISVDNGWAFDTGVTWTYLPWNKAFESFHNISETDYRISVPDHLKVPVIP